MAKQNRQRALAGFERDDPAPGGRCADPAAGAERLRGRTAYVIDAHSLIYQVFHALPEMTAPSGQPVAAVYGFLRDLLGLLEKKQPDYLLCALDHPGETFRHRIYDQYKMGRPPMPPDLQLQISQIRRLLSAMRIPVVEAAAYEADDVMATIARRVEQAGGQCFLVTSDKDCRQLITDRVKVYNIRKDEVVDAAAVQADWGVPPSQAVDLQALWGDAVDHIPGVPGIGKKTARELLRQYGSLDGVLDHAHEITATKRRESLLSGREQALLSRRLVRLTDDVPIDVDWAASRAGNMDEEAVAKLCREFGFHRLAERLGRLAAREAPDSWKADYRLIATPDQLDWLAGQLAGQPRFALDTETTSTNPRWADIVGYSFAWREGEAYYVPVRAPAGQPQLDPDRVREALRPVLENPAIEKIGQNLKYEMVVLRSAGVTLRGVALDTMVADYLLAPGERNHSLDDLAKRYLDHDTIKIAEVIGSGKKQIRMDQAPVEQVLPYAAEDADVPLRLSRILPRRLEENGLEGLYAELEIPLIEVLAEMQFHGVRVDVARLEELSRRFGRRMAALETEIHELAGGPFNIDSPMQLGKVLFDQLRLPVVKKTKTGWSTDADVLAQLARLHPLPAKVMEYRRHAKLKSTYVDALPALVYPQTGRVHTSFKQDVAATGRLASTEPNLQNIPVRTEEGRAIRSAFLPSDGWRLLSLDYSQIELRVLAHFSGDETLLEAFHQDQDVHALVASEVFDTTLDQVTWEMRRRAKAVNFGVIYGQSPFGLAKSLDISKDEAASFIDAYFTRYAGVDRFMREILDQCREKGYVSTILGRRRAVQGVRDPSQRGDSHQRSLPERIAINTVIQGSAADLIKRAMIRVLGRLRRDKFRAHMLLQIHDELVFEVPPEELADAAALAAEEMTGAAPLAAPLKVDIKSGVNWAECEPWDGSAP